MNIDELTTSITEMSPKEQYEYILALRKRRRVAQETPRRKKKVSKKPTNVVGIVNSLTSEQAAKLLSMLEGA